MGKVAIVIMYDGTEPDDIIKSSMCNVLTKSGYCDCKKEVNVYFVNEKEVVQAVVSKTVPNVVSEHFYKSETHLTEQELAATFIAGVCKDSINKSSSLFAADFGYKFYDALCKGNNPQLLEAVNILVRDDAMSHISEKIRRETGFNDVTHRIVLNVSNYMRNV